MMKTNDGRVASPPSSCPSDQAASHPAPSGFDPSRNGLRHYPRRHWSGEMHIVDREFDFVRCRLAYDYRFTSNSQQWREAEAICRALEGPMEAMGVLPVAPADAEAEHAARRARAAQEPWPALCIKPGACSRHRRCMYALSSEACRHFGRDIGAEIDAAASAMEARRAGTQGGPVHDSAVGGNAETPSPTPAPLPMED